MHIYQYLSQTEDRNLNDVEFFGLPHDLCGAVAGMVLEDGVSYLLVNETRLNETTGLLELRGHWLETYDNPVRLNGFHVQPVHLPETQHDERYEKLWNGLDTVDSVTFMRCEPQELDPHNSSPEGVHKGALTHLGYTVSQLDTDVVTPLFVPTLCAGAWPGHLKHRTIMYPEVMGLHAPAPPRPRASDDYNHMRFAQCTPLTPIHYVNPVECDWLLESDDSIGFPPTEFIAAWGQ